MRTFALSVPLTERRGAPVTPRPGDRRLVTVEEPIRAPPRAKTLPTNTTVSEDHANANETIEIRSRSGTGTSADTIRRRSECPARTRGDRAAFFSLWRLGPNAKLSDSLNDDLLHPGMRRPGTGWLPRKRHRPVRVSALFLSVWAVLGTGKGPGSEIPAPSRTCIHPRPLRLLQPPPGSTRPGTADAVVWLDSAGSPRRRAWRSARAREGRPQQPATSEVVGLSDDMS